MQYFWNKFNGILVLTTLKSAYTTDEMQGPFVPFQCMLVEITMHCLGICVQLMNTPNIEDSSCLIAVFSFYACIVGWKGVVCKIHLAPYFQFTAPQFNPHTPKTHIYLLHHSRYSLDQCRTKMVFMLKVLLFLMLLSTLHTLIITSNKVKSLCHIEYVGYA